MSQVYHWTLSLTASGGLTSDNIEVAKGYFDEKCQYAYIVNEFGSAGTNSHLQCVVSFTTKKQSNVKQKMESLYKKMGVEIVNRHTCVVKAATHMDGALHYVSKELSGKGKLVLLKGWRQGWIDTQVKEFVKKTPRIEFQSMGVRLTQTSAPGAMFKWAVANNMQVTDKRSFINVGKLMTAEGYMFGTCRAKGIYMDVCGLFKDGRALGDVWEAELAFVRD